MFEDIWYHALQFLENYKYDKHNYGPSELYKFADDTGILARHRQRMERPFTEKDIDIKVSPQSNWCGCYCCCCCFCCC